VCVRVCVCAHVCVCMGVCACRSMHSSHSGFSKVAPATSVRVTADGTPRHTNGGRGWRMAAHSSLHYSERDDAGAQVTGGGAACEAGGQMLPLSGELRA
jgi:hypothetical protein